MDGRPEAHILADIAHDYWHIPHSRLVVEDQSTNCGENARFTRTTLESRGSPIVAGSSFRTRLCSGEPWLPSPASGRGDDAAAVVELSRLLAGAGADRWPTGVRGRRSGALAGHPLPALLLGELPRLQDTPEGYGPRGKDFISHVTFPPEILDARRQLREDAQLAGALQARTLG